MSTDAQVEALAVLLHNEIGGCCVEGLSACVFGGDPTREEARRVLASPAFRAIMAGERAAALREAADALGEYADETYWRDDSPFHAAQNFALGDTAADWLRERADQETPMSRETP